MSYPPHSQNVKIPFLGKVSMVIVIRQSGNPIKTRFLSITNVQVTTHIMFLLSRQHYIVSHFLNGQKNEGIIVDAQHSPMCPDRVAHDLSCIMRSIVWLIRFLW